MAYPPSVPNDPAFMLSQAVQAYLREGWRIESHGPYMAVLCWGGGQVPPVNHILHLLLSLVTCGFWLPVWILLIMFKPKPPPFLRVVLAVDQYGNVHRS